MANFAERYPVVGSDARVRLLTGEMRRVVKLNNAATTPPFHAVVSASADFMQAYDALHRGAGVHAEEMVQNICDASRRIREFIGASDGTALLYGSNTSDMILKLARLFRFRPDDVVLTSDVEHTSNYLPWKYASGATVREFASDQSGSFQPDAVASALEGEENVKLVAITGASNLTGFIPDLRRISKTVHDHGALLFVDAAQLAPHRPVEMRRNGVDFLAFSAHKLYAPYGLGVLAGPGEWFEGRDPAEPAGGSPDYVSDEGIVWTRGPVRHQPGTWNANGIAALSESFNIISRIGWQNILKHEGGLVEYALARMSGMPGVVFPVPPETFLKESRTAVLPFNVDGFHYALVSSYLAHEFAISTRSGEICNHRLLAKWNHFGTKQIRDTAARVAAGDLLCKPGVVRVSIGLFNTLEDVDVLVSGLGKLISGGCKLKYAPVSLPEPAFEVKC